ncbi:MAG: tetratricopeptide repeat protein [bacterium]
MRTLRIIAAVALVAVVALTMAGCGGKGSVNMTSGKVYYHRNQDYARAELKFRDAIAEDPSNWEASFYLALSLAQQGKFAEAGETFRATRSIAPPDKLAMINDNQQTFFADHFKAGLSAKDTNNFEEAAAEFERAVAVDPDEPNGYINLAYAYEKLGMDDKSLEATKKAVQADSMSFYAWANLGTAYRATKQDDLAAEAFMRVIALSPTDENIKFSSLASLGDIMFAKKDYEKALQYYTQAAEVKSEEASLQYQIGAVHYQAEAYTEAAASFQRCAALAKDKDAALYNDAMYNLAAAYYNAKDYNAAVGTVEALLQSQDSADAHELLGRIYGAMELKDKAIEEFRKAEALRGK